MKPNTTPTKNQNLEFSEKDLEKLSTLSRLHIEKKDEEGLRHDLSKIKKLLDEVSTFNIDKLSKVAADSHVFDVLRFEKDAPTQKPAVRKDIPHHSMPITETEKLAPQFAMRHFVVPQIIEGEE